MEVKHYVHQTNNELTVIIGNIELAMQLEPDNVYLKEAHAAAYRIADLTREMAKAGGAYE